MTFVIVFIVVALLVIAILVPLNVYMVRKDKEAEKVRRKEREEEFPSSPPENARQEERTARSSMAGTRNVREDIYRQTDEEYREALRRGLRGQSGDPNEVSEDDRMEEYKDESYRSALRSIYKKQDKKE
jgi:flagellar biosynthesis/type III secretory pathway M-ring protein FliF/YscJ